MQKKLQLKPCLSTATACRKRQGETRIVFSFYLSLSVQQLLAGLKPLTLWWWSDCSTTMLQPLFKAIIVKTCLKCQVYNWFKNFFNQNFEFSFKRPNNEKWKTKKMEFKCFTIGRRCVANLLKLFWNLIYIC